VLPGLELVLEPALGLGPVLVPGPELVLALVTVPVLVPGLELVWALGQHRRQLIRPPVLLTELK
jgi:hypothetical protein